MWDQMHARVYNTWEEVASYMFLFYFKRWIYTGCIVLVQVQTPPLAFVISIDLAKLITKAWVGREKKKKKLEYFSTIAHHLSITGPPLPAGRLVGQYTDIHHT